MHMVKSYLAGRAIVHFPYRSKTTGKTYNSVILVLDSGTGKYSLPGGKLDWSKGDGNTLDTALRELEEELGLIGDRGSARWVYTFHGNVVTHDVYVVKASGTLYVDPAEVSGIGFFNAGRHNQIPDRLLERHVKELVSYFRNYRVPIYTSPVSKIKIPGYYFIGNRDPRIVDWDTQRKSW